MKLQFKDYNDTKCLATFLNALDISAQNNTYKSALARFLLDYSLNNTEPHVSFREIAQYFLEYYWPQECKLKLIQGPINQQPTIISIICKKFEKEYYSETFDDIKDDYPNEVNWCVEEITKQCFKDVIHRFQKKGGVENRIIYEYTAIEYGDSSGNANLDLQEGIQLNQRAMDFFRQNYELLFNTVVFKWVEFLELYNIGSPQLTSKVRGLPGPRNQGKYKADLMLIQSECFYCTRSLADIKINVDHVIPYDYIGQTELRNLVLACRECNCRKRAHLPPEEYIEKLIERNRKSRGEIPKLDKSLNRLGRYHEATMRQLYYNAKNSRFDILEDFP